MKIQCSCGAKYELELTPELAQGLVSFVCPTCGVDSTAFLASLAQKELGQRDRCPRHPAEQATERCRICSKPICPRCMELFGYVCSPLCKAKAESARISLPEYAGLRSTVDARFWRRAGRVAWALGVVVVVGLSLWIWYAWIGSEPRIVFSRRFADPAYSGQSAWVRPDQLLFLHGGLLARQDLKTKKEIWSCQLLQPQEIEAKATAQWKTLRNAADHAAQDDPDHIPKVPSPDRLRELAEREAAAALELRVSGRNVWVLSPGQLTRYDWDTGKTVSQIPLPAGASGFIEQGDQMQWLGQTEGDRLMRVDLNTCESRTEPIGKPKASSATVPNPGEDLKAPGAGGTVHRGRTGDLAGLPGRLPGSDADRAMSASRVAQQAQHLSLPARIALPVILLNNRSQERALAEMSDSPSHKPAPTAGPEVNESVSFVPTKEGFARFSVRLLERRIVTRSGMKPGSGQSALDGALTASKSTELANEILNDMQRSRGGDVVQEDESRYRVSLEGTDGKDGWTSELAGPPALFPLQTVNVVAADKTLVVLDKTGHVLWQTTLNYPLSAGPGAWPDSISPCGQGPCVEHKTGLYVFDQGVLTAFELNSGNVRWRLPSVGIAGVFFDREDMIYVNSTTAGLDTIKFSRQIDISQKTHPVVLKIDSRSGRILWSERPGAMIRYVSGKFIFTVQAYVPEEEDPDAPPPIETGFEAQPHVTIQRLNPRTGHEMWTYYEPRAPLDVQFEQNTIRLIFKKEVEVLKFLAL